MDKIAMSAVAGAGKTTLIINELDKTRRVAIITYTTANQDAIRNSIIFKYGSIPPNISVFGYFEFLYSFCYYPLQTTAKNNGICFDIPHYLNRKNYTSDGRIYSNRLAKHIIDNNLPYLDRISKYFDHIYIDEMQDFGSYDFDWMLSLRALTSSVTLVGDFYQSTFVTSRSGNKNANIHQNYNQYKEKVEKAGFLFDDVTLKSSFRCSHDVCNFIREKLSIDIISNRDKSQDNTEVVVVTDPDKIREILDNDDIKKLFYQKHSNYKCNSENWGASKGLTYGDVCVVLNATTAKLFRSNKLQELAPLSLSKFYVACSRPTGHLFFIEESKIPEHYKI